MNISRASYLAIAVACVSLAIPASVIAAEAAPEASGGAAAAAEDEIIVTGTRSGGITAAESAAPIKVLDSAALSHVGQPNLNQVLTQLVPSFSAESFGGDTANLTLSARLRGLSPNQTLVLVNGKRRHGTANLHVLGGPYQGAASPDLDLISPESIARIEVLEDGAAAQYGSDAIAGVINIILKSDSEGGEATATAGQYYKSGGQTYSGSAHIATKLGDDGFLNLTLFHRYHDFSQNGGIDTRVTDATGTLRTTLSAAQQAAYRTIPGFPFVNRIRGDAQSHLTNAQYNAGYNIGDVQVYSFGSYSKRIASAYENLRVPDRVIASPVLGVAGTFTTPGELIFAPNGFNPREGLREDDYSSTGGIKGDIGGFHFDLSTTYGVDKNQIYTLDSANRSLYIDTHTTPTNFYDGFFKSSEWTTNLDLNHEFDVGMATPLNLAFGAEYRENKYEIGQGDPGSIYKEGGQSYPGFRPTDAGRHGRDNSALYVDVALSPIEGLKLDGAARYEHYSDFGNKTIFKGTGRYDFSSMFAVRGTVATGFRAPTLAEEFYSATNVSPTSATVQLPANSAAAKLLGFTDLKPEKATNVSLGAVVRPVERLTITVDAYQVKIKDRVLGTGTIFGSGGATNFAAVNAAILANGNILDPTVTQTGVSIFTNGADTRTRGIDVVASYMTDFGNAGTVNWTLSANFNTTKLTKLGRAPTALTPAGATVPIALFDQTSTSLLERGSPKMKLIGGINYTLAKFSLIARETIYGKTSADYSPNGNFTTAGTTYATNKVPTTGITDLEIGYQLTGGLSLAAGANNLFDKKPPNIITLPNGSISDGGNVFDAPLSISPYGINGGYYYGRVTLKF